MSVYRLVTEGTVEERLILRAEKKLYLDRMVMGRHTLAANAGTEMVRFGRARPAAMQRRRRSDPPPTQLERLSRSEILSMLMFGADRIFRAQGQEAVNDKDIELVRTARAPPGSKTQR